MKRIFLLLMLLPGSVMALEIGFGGYIAGEARWFVENPQFQNQFDGAQLSIVLQPEIETELHNGDDQFSLIPFARVDNQNDRRTHVDLREAYWRHIENQWEILVGLNRVFWGVTESRHLVDIVNQTDQVESLDGEEKLGQPMLQLSAQQDWGDVSLFLMPWFRERSFSSKDGRLRFPLVIDSDAKYESGAKQDQLSVALRYSHYIGEWDFGAHYFNGVGREPRFRVNTSGSRFIPVYDRIEQIGVDVQRTHDAWLWKLEGLVRIQNGDRFAALVGGLEYTLYQLLETSADLGLLFEYLYDGRNEDPAKAPPVLMDDDLFVGARYAMNDTQSTEILAGVIVDRSDQSASLSIEAERRINNQWKVELESRWFSADDQSLLAAFKKDSYITFTVSNYF